MTEEIDKRTVPMEGILEYYERKWDYYDIENNRSDVFKLAKDYADYCVAHNKNKN